MQTIYLDISNKGVVPTIYAKQGDVGRTFSIVLTEAGVPYNIPSGSVFSAWYSGKSGSGNYTDIGADSAFSVKDNSVAVEMISQMLQIPGDGIFCVVLSKSNGDQIGMWNIPYVCEEVPGYGSDAAQDYFTAFSQAVQNLPYPDASLSLVGKAADAAAVGAALAGKAPAGYGLGGRGASCTDPNTAVNSGFYGFTGDNCVNLPTEIGHKYGTLLVERRGQADIEQEATFRMYSIKRNSGDAGSTWSEWEWVNPPMTLGVEYRTTERWNGEPVYTMAFNFGALPNNDMKTVSNIVNADAEEIRIDGVVTSGDGNNYPLGIPFVQLAGAFANHTSKGYVTLETWDDYSDCNAIIFLKYVVRKQ